jgi:hypothetical protein
LQIEDCIVMHTRQEYNMNIHTYSCKYTVQMRAASVQYSMKGCTVVHVFRIGLNKQVKCLLQVQYNDNNKPKQCTSESASAIVFLLSVWVAWETQKSINVFKYRMSPQFD